MSRWALYVVTLGFAVYWASNLLLWFPWSYSAVLGMSLMLTVAPVLWGYVTFLCLRTYPGRDPMDGALRTAAILVALAVVLDFVFFGLVRNAMEQLYHPTTFYAYGFLLCLPLIVAMLFRNTIGNSKAQASIAAFVSAGISGFACFAILTLIILLDIGV